MTTHEIKVLDRIWQKKIISSKAGAAVAHHFITKGAGGLAIRWWIPDGIPMTNDEHLAIHGRDKKMIEDMIIIKNGERWIKELRIRAQMVAKNVKFGAVCDYLNGLRPDYL